jgi:cytochrome c biogenesis protein CcmG, thiol:disulfide interchange protein DsbE
MSWRRALIGGLSALPIIALLAFGLTLDPQHVRSPLPGRDAPDFALPIMGTQDSVRLSDFHGQVVVLNFWASWCVPCRVEHPALTATAAEYYDRDVRFVGVLYRDLPDAAYRWIERLGGINYPSLDDAGSRTAIDYGLAGVPETFIIGRDGTVAYKHIGPITAGRLREILDPLVALP